MTTKHNKYKDGTTPPWNIKHRREHVNRGEQWAPGADLGRLFVKQVTNKSLSSKLAKRISWTFLLLQ